MKMKMKKQQLEIDQYQEMVQELNLIRKAVNMAWRQQQKKLLNEWLKEDLK